MSYYTSGEIVRIRGEQGLFEIESIVGWTGKVNVKCIYTGKTLNYICEGVLVKVAIPNNRSEPSVGNVNVNVIKTGDVVTVKGFTVCFNVIAIYGNTVELLHIQSDERGKYLSHTRLPDIAINSINLASTK